MGTLGFGPGGSMEATPSVPSPPVRADNMISDFSMTEGVF